MGLGLSLYYMVKLSMKVVLKLWQLIY